MFVKLNQDDFHIPRKTLDKLEEAIEALEFCVMHNYPGLRDSKPAIRANVALLFKAYFEQEYLLNGKSDDEPAHSPFDRTPRGVLLGLSSAPSLRKQQKR